MNLLDSPAAKIVGGDKDHFAIRVQPMSWHNPLKTGSQSSVTIEYAPKTAGEKSATLLLYNSDLYNGGYAIQLKGSATGEAIGDPESAADLPPELEAGQYLYTANCASCHGALGSSTKVGTSESALFGALNPLTGIVQMKALGNILTESEIQKIVLALNTPIVEPADDAVRPQDFAVSIGTAQYVADSLREIFLPPGDPSTYSTTNLDIWKIISERVLGLKVSGTNLLITGRAMHFGGRCQRFEDNCLSELWEGPMLPLSSAARTGLFKQTCDLLSANTNAVNNALSKIGANSSAPITKQVVKDLYEQLFAPGRPTPPYLIDAFSTYSNQAPVLTQLDRYKYLINMMCISGILEGI
jgi:hypothetical protein